MLHLRNSKIMRRFFDMINQWLMGRYCHWVGCWEYRDINEVAIEFFLATSCLFLNSEGKNSDFDSCTRNYSTQRVGQDSVGRKLLFSSFGRESALIFNVRVIWFSRIFLTISKHSKNRKCMFISGVFVPFSADGLIRVMRSFRSTVKTGAKMTAMVHCIDSIFVLRAFKLQRDSI